MKVEGWMFAAIAIFLAIVTPIYWFMSHEIIGTVALILTFAFAAMLTVYLWVQASKIDPRPEDRKDGEIVENAGALGFFPPSSIVPFWSTVAITAMLLGAVYGWWISLLGVGLGIWAACGWAYEFYTGDYKH